VGGLQQISIAARTVWPHWFGWNMKTESSITRNTLRKMAARIAVVILISTTIAYFYILDNLEKQNLAQLERYVSERGQRERALFSLAESTHISIGGIRNEQGEVEKFVALIQDITEQKSKTTVEITPT
jgi:PAS domain-containing protein